MTADIPSTSLGMQPLAVVVPIYNEERLLRGTLEALAEQVDTDFHIVLVDNGSNDRSPNICHEFADHYPRLRWSILHEEDLGTGAAADTGFRYAISCGARIIARTDADSLPTPDWTLQVRRAFQNPRLMLAVGKSVPRTDDVALSMLDRTAIAVLIMIGKTFLRCRPSNRGTQSRGRYMLVAGHNLALRSELYLSCGGFPRVDMTQEFEDAELLKRARTRTNQIARVSSMVVATSVRRVRAYGWLGTLNWYWRRSTRKTVNVR